MQQWWQGCRAPTLAQCPHLQWWSVGLPMPGCSLDSFSSVLCSWCRCWGCTLFLWQGCRWWARFKLKDLRCKAEAFKLASNVRGRDDWFDKINAFLLLKRGLQPPVQLKTQSLYSQKCAVWNSTIHNVELLPLAHSTLDDTKRYLLAVGWTRAWASKCHSAFSLCTWQLQPPRCGARSSLQWIPLMRGHPTQRRGTRACFVLLCRLTGRLGPHFALNQIYSIAIKSMFISTFIVRADAVSINFTHS